MTTTHGDTTPPNMSARASLRPFRMTDAERVASWAPTPQERDAWASLGQAPVTSEVFARWHSDDDVLPFVLSVGEEAIGYGEVWRDAPAREAELARIIVAPHARGQGWGRTLTSMLASQARRLGYVEVWLRVLPDNHSAIKAYAAANFTRATAVQERNFNVGQPRPYVWMRAPREI